MDEQRTNPHENLEPHSPETMAWVMFRIASHERLLQMRQGLLYMNSLTYFSSLEEDHESKLRSDPFEKVFQRVYAGPSGKYVRKIFIQIGEGEGSKTMDAGDKAVLTVEAPDPNNTMIFCMSALADDETGKIPGERDGKIYFDERLLKFGSHMLIINNAKEFMGRLSKAIEYNNNIYGGSRFYGGFGLVQYLDLHERSGHIGLFRKDKKYEWQHEYRICFGVKDQGLNNIGAFELQIGDISDISQIIPVQSVLDAPVTIKRHVARLVNGKYEAE